MELFIGKAGSYSLIRHVSCDANDPRSAGRVGGGEAVVHDRMNCLAPSHYSEQPSLKSGQRVFNNLSGLHQGVADLVPFADQPGLQGAELMAIRLQSGQFGDGL